MTEPSPTPNAASASPTPVVTPTVRRSGCWGWLFFGSIAALIAIVSFGVGMVAERTLLAGGSLFERAAFLGRGIESDGSGVAVDAALPRYAEVRGLLEEEYFFRPPDADALATFQAELDHDALAGMATAAATPAASIDAFQRQVDYGAVRGMTEGLTDDYTVFLEPIVQAEVAEELQGEYEGIGVWVEQPEGKVTIVAPIPGSPAEEVGLQTGDVIEAADGTLLQGLTNDDALGLVRGPAGTSVLLRIRREGEPAPLEVRVERRAIVIPAVTYEAVADGRVAHIAILIFNDQTTRQLDEALARAKREGVAGIALDLRGNTGGWVTAAQEAVGRFVPADRGAALYEDDQFSDANEPAAEGIIGGGEEVFDLPLVVLTDGGTASAAEIVAGALRDYGRATLIGANTFGKGLVQRVHDFPDGSSARITFARWLTPNKLPIPEDGLRPDIVVEPPTPPPAGTPVAATPGASPVGAPVAATPDASPAGVAATPATSAVVASPVGGTPAATPAATPIAASPVAIDPVLERAIEVVLGRTE